MSNWGTYANSNEREDESDLSSYEDSEEEDTPLQINSWGDNNVVARVNEEGTTEVDVSSNGWASLIDPNHKIGANGLGSGNLHRKGGNFKPVDEEYILNHRLKKGGGLPKAPGSGSKKKKKKPAAAAPPTHARGGHSSFGRNAGPPPRQGHRPAPPPPPSTTRRPPPQSRLVDGSATGWGSQKLADTPFWEQPAAVKATPPARAATAPPANHHQPAFSSGSAASKYATGAAASRYAPQQQQQQQQQQPAYNAPTWSGSNSSQYAPQSSYPSQQAPAAMGSGSSRYATQSQGSPSTYTAPTQEQQHMSTTSTPSSFVSGASASKYATGSSASKYAPQNGGSSASMYASPSPSAPTPPPAQQQHLQPQQERKPILTFNIELVPGVSAPLNVYENSNPIELVDIFEREHNLHMQPVAKETFARNIATLVGYEMNKRYGGDSQ